MLERFLKVDAVFTYLPKFGFDTSKGSLVFRTGKVAIFTTAITEHSFNMLPNKLKAWKGLIKMKEP